MPALDDEIELLAKHLEGARVVALTGAGVSTESGIPDYRSPETLATSRVRRPIQGPEFVRSASLRRRYWARATAGWDRFRAAKPNAAHLGIAKLEAHGVVGGVITQNVDRLHHRAGSRAITELHGALEEVVCLECKTLEARDALQARIRALNPDFLDRGGVAPDGDADLPTELVDRFVVPGCTSCGGTLKPNVVFFGHNVDKSIVEEAFARVDAADVLVICGTSLAVFSGYRFLLRATERKMPVLVINRGPVRGEERASLKIEASTGRVIEALTRRLVD